jgi:phosphate acetyltransferase
MKSLYIIPYTKNRIIVLYFLESLKSRYKKVELIKVTSIDETISKFEKSEADFVLFEGNLEIDNKFLAENLQSGVIGVFEDKEKEIKIDNYLGSIIIPKLEELNKIPFKQLIEELNLEVVLEGDFQKDIKDLTIVTMQVDKFLKSVKDDELIITNSDRNDVLLASMSLLLSQKSANPSAILLTDKISKILKIINDFPVKMPILATNKTIAEITKEFYNLTPNVDYLTKDKLMNIFAKLDKIIDKDYFLNKLKTPTNEITPLIFKYKMYEKAKQDKKIILLDELDDRILKASEIILNKELANIIFIGNEKEFKNRANIIGVDISKAKIINPKTSKYKDEFIEKFYELRKHKGITKAQSKEIIENQTIYFATMMVYLGYADGLVSGAIHTTANTIRPALQIIKTTPDTPLVSSLFFMLLEDKVLVFADCAINEKPDSNELAIIAISTHDTAKKFGITPKVALLSYSTKGSGKGEDVEKVEKALEIVKEKRKDILIDGPLQYDAAVDKEVANKKAPTSKVAGDANVLIFPDLDTGNITYKAVQRSAGAIAVGPIMQGLKKPVNDLSRGCSIEDIIDTIVITAVQAQK